MPDLATLKEWCQQARKLLDRLGKDRRGKMEARTDEVVKLLEQMQDIPELTKEYQECRRTYEELATKAHTAFENQEQGKIKAQEAKAIVQTVSRDLSILKNVIREHLAEHSGDVEGAKVAGEKALKKFLEEVAVVGKAENQYELIKSKVETAIRQVEITPKGDPTELKNLFARAEEEAKNGDFEAAVVALGGYGTLLKKALAEAVKKQKADLLQQAQEPVYLSRRGQLELWVATMADHAEISGERNKVVTALAQAKEKAEAQDFIAASKILSELGKIEQEAQKKSDKELQKVLKDKDLAKAWESAEAAVTALAKLADEDEVADAQKRVRAALNLALLNPDSTNQEAIRKRNAMATTELTEVAQALDQRTADLQKLKQDCERRLGIVKGTLGMIAEVLPLADAAEFQVRYERLAAALESKRYAETAQPLELLDQQTVAAGREQMAAKNEWDKIVGEVKSLQDSCRNGLQPHDLTKQRGQELAEQLTDALALAQDRDFSGAVALVETCRDEIQTQLKLVQPWIDLGPARKNADEAVQQQAKAVQEAIATLTGQINTELTKRGGTEDDTAGSQFGGELQDVRDEWKQALAIIGDPQELQLKQQGTLDDLAELLRRIEAAGKDPAQLGGLADDKIRQQKRAEYERQQTATNQVLAELQGFDGKAAAPFSQQLKTIQSQVAEADKDPQLAYDPSLKAVGELQQQITEALEKLKQRQANLQSSVQLKYEDVAKQIQALEEEVAKGEKGKYHEFFEKMRLVAKTDSQFKPFFDSFRQELSDLKALTASTSVTALETANRELQVLLERKTQIEIELTRQVSGPGLGFDGVVNMIDSITKSLGDDNLKTCTPKVQAQLTEEFKGLKEQAYALEPKAGFAVLLKFLNDPLAKALQQAAAAAGERSAFQFNVQQVNKILEQLETLEPKSEYVKALRGRITQAEKQSQQEGKEKAASDALFEIRKEAHAALSKPEVRKEKETGAREDIYKQEQAKALWENTLKVFRSQEYKNAKSAVAKAPEGDKSQIDEIDRLVKQAEGSAKSGDYTKAQEQLKLARERAVTVFNNPQGERITSRNNLPQDEERWKAAVGKWNDTLKELASGISTEAEATARELAQQEGLQTKRDEVQSAATKAGELLAGLQLEFNAGAYAKPIKILSGKNEGDKARRAAREEALKLVRRNRASLLKGPLMAQLLSNPFDKNKLIEATRDLNYALESLDANIQRCVQ